jgi:MFS transporter, Spinster family, sphingosine-1-phosphate transporter
VIKNRVGILSLLTALNLINYLDRYLVMAVGPRFEDELRLTDWELGLVEVAFMVGYLITSPIFGRLGDRYPRRALIAAGVALWSVATVVSGLAHGAGSMLAARIAVGIGEASYATIGPTIIIDLAPREAQNRWLAIFYGAMPVGAALGYILGGMLEPIFGWRGAFFVCGGPGLLLAAMVLLIAEPARGHADQGAHESMRVVYRDLFRNVPYRLAVLGYVAQTFAIGGFSSWAVPFFERKLSLPLSNGNQVFGAITATTGLVGTALGGILADRIPGEDRTRVNLRVCAWSSALSVPFAVAALLYFRIEGAFVALGICQLAVFASTSPINAALLLSVPPRVRASAMAASIFFLHLLGDIISQPLIGAIAAAFHDSHAPGSGARGLQIGMYLLPAALAVSAVVWLAGSRAPALKLPDTA